jgi:hypothetical protein
MTDAADKERKKKKRHPDAADFISVFEFVARIHPELAPGTTFPEHVPTRSSEQRFSGRAVIFSRDAIRFPGRTARYSWYLG